MIVVDDNREVVSVDQNEIMRREARCGFFFLSFDRRRRGIYRNRVRGHGVKGVNDGKMVEFLTRTTPIFFKKF